VLPDLAVTSLHITNAYHAASGGVRTFYDALLDAANRDERPVRLLVPGDRTSVRDVGAFGRVYVVKAPRVPAFDRRYRFIPPSAYWPGLRSALLEALERERPSLVEISDKYSLPYLAAMLRKGWHARVPRPVLVGLSHERFDDNMRAYLSGAATARAFTRWYIRHVYGPPFDAHIAVSAYAACELRAALHDRPDGFVRVCGMGVDARRFAPHRRSAVTRSRLLRMVGGTDQSVLLLYAGRVSPEKNVVLLVDLMRELAADRDDYRLIVAGAGPSADALGALAAAVPGNRVFAAGAIDRDTLADWCASADVFVHPNPHEPFGIGPLEAMASGVPLVAPAAGGVLEYATADNAWLAEPTGQAFADAVRAARAGDAHRIASALDTVGRFTWPDATRRFFAAYDDITHWVAGQGVAVRVT
jgi:alpha-1,6-mannosyltransferase